MLTHRKWNVGDCCRVIPDRKNPDRVCDGTVLMIRQRSPYKVRCERDPVWAGTELFVNNNAAKVLESD